MQQHPLCLLPFARPLHALLTSTTPQLPAATSCPLPALSLPLSLALSLSLSLPLSLSLSLSLSLPLSLSLSLSLSLPLSLALSLARSLFLPLPTGGCTRMPVPPGQPLNPDPNPNPNRNQAGAF